jgi:VanZ family protein
MTTARFERLARVLFWIALIGAIVLALMPQPPHLPTDRFGDKVNHMIAFATLSALAALGWPRAEKLRIVERLSFLGALIEVTQAMPALHRDCDIRDWAADTVAIVVVTLLFALFARRREPVAAG